ncbi:MAG: hypothetical protein LAP87_27780 [Acidobacteriia bacterium]|nr:hypothetical protein [Terriglobia bacterium]
MAENTIRDLESLIEQRFLSSLGSLPQLAGYRPRVSLLDKKGRKKRHSASAENWLPESDEIRVSFESDDRAPASAPAETPPPPQTEAPVRTGPPASGPIHDLVRSLERAESKQGFSFVALKWFRDSVLPAVRPEWADSDGRNAALRDAIERRLILTSRVPNPKSPEFPVTAIRVNRSLPEVQAILGSSSETGDTDFQPVTVRGEPLSATILRERR